MCQPFGRLHHTYDTDWLAHLRFIHIRVTRINVYSSRYQWVISGSTPGKVVPCMRMGQSFVALCVCIPPIKTSERTRKRPGLAVLWPVETQI